MSNDFYPKHQAADTFYFVPLHEEKVGDEETAEKEERVNGEQSLLHCLHGERVLYFVQRPDRIVQEWNCKVESVPENDLRMTGKITFSHNILLNMELTQVILRNLIPCRQLRSSLLLEMLNNLGRFLLIEKA